MKGWRWLIGGGVFALVAGCVIVWWGTQQPAHHWRLGKLALQRRDLQQLNHEIQALEPYEEYRTQVELMRGMVFLIGERYADAITEFQHVANNPELKKQATLWAGEALCRMGRQADALSLLNGVVSIDEMNLEAHRWLSVAYYDLGANDHAMHELQIVAELDPDDPRPHRLMGLMHKDAERFEDAIRDYRISLERDPQQPQREDILLELAQSLVKVHKYQEAREALDQAQPSPEALALRAECQFSEGDKAKARETALASLKLDPKQLAALSLLGTLELESGQPEGAITYLKTAVAAHPTDFAAHFKLSQAYSRLGQKEEAQLEQQESDKYRKLFEEFNKLHVEATQQPQNAEIRYRLGQMARQLKRDDLAEMWFKAALALNPRHIAARKALAEIAAAAEFRS